MANVKKAFGEMYQSDALVVALTEALAEGPQRPQLDKCYGSQPETNICRRFVRRSQC